MEMRIICYPEARNLRSSPCTLVGATLWAQVTHKTLTHAECTWTDLDISSTHTHTHTHTHTRFPLKHNLHVLRYFGLLPEADTAPAPRFRVTAGNTSGQRGSQVWWWGGRSRFVSKQGPLWVTKSESSWRALGRQSRLCLTRGREWEAFVQLPPPHH